MSNLEQSHEVKHSPKDLSKEKKKGKKAIIAAIAAGVLVVGVGGAMLFSSGTRENSNNSSNNTSQQNKEVDSTPRGPQIPEKAEAYGGIEPGLKGEELTKAFEIPAGLSDQEYADALAARLSAWTMYGATPDIAKKYWGQGGDSKGQALSEVNDLSRKNAINIGNALFSKDIRPQHQQSIDKVKAHYEQVNGGSVRLWLQTIPYPEISPEDKEAYRRYQVVVKVVNLADIGADTHRSDKRALNITVLEKANIDKNNAGNLGGEAVGSSGNSVTYSIRTTVVNGVEKLEQFTYM